MRGSMTGHGRRAARAAAAAGFLGVLVVATSARPAAAATCGDVNGNGTVTVTDGVVMLRAAARLESCDLKICDLTLDGRMSVTDGVLALRRAAGLEAQASCVDEQIDQQIARIDTFLNLGIGALPAARARIAQSTPCPGGGFTNVTATAIQAVDCREGDLLINGTIFFAQTAEDVIEFIADGYTVLNVVTGESLVSSGDLAFTLDASGGFTIDGAIARQSSALGGYVDRFGALTADADGVPYLGEVVTEVTDGIGLFANLAEIRTNFLGGISLLFAVTFADGSVEGFVRDGSVIGLCDACETSDDCDPVLGCFPCDTDCTGTTSRCSVRLNLTVDCGDGRF